MKFTIVTNNPLVYDKLHTKYSVEFQEITYEELLNKVRDKVHQGYKLLTHPLSGSVKPKETPYKSVMLSEDAGKFDVESLEIIENCIATCRKFPDKSAFWSDRVLQDFQLVDFTLIDSGIFSVEAF